MRLLKRMDFRNQNKIKVGTKMSDYYLLFINYIYL